MMRRFRLGFTPTLVTSKDGATFLRTRRNVTRRTRADLAVRSAESDAGCRRCRMTAWMPADLG